jgi:hypothetical protein
MTGEDIAKFAAGKALTSLFGGNGDASAEAEGDQNFGGGATPTNRSRSPS